MVFSHKCRLNTRYVLSIVYTIVEKDRQQFEMRLLQIAEDKKAQR